VKDSLTQQEIVLISKSTNMKKWITASMILSCSTLLAQQKEGTILYEKKVNLHKTIQNEQMKAMMPEFRTSRHQLLFSDSVSIYRMIPEVEAPDPFSSGGGGRVMISVGGGSDGGDLYKNFAQAKGIQSSEFGGKSYLIIDTLKPEPWKMTEETKNILGFKCYKATRKVKQTQRAVIRTFGGPPNSSIDTTKKQPSPEMKEIDIIAWFTNEIITPAGPENYGQLPGLILELDIENGTTVFSATEVKKTVNKKELKEPQKGKPVSRQEFQKIMFDLMSSQAPGGFKMSRN